MFFIFRQQARYKVALRWSTASATPGTTWRNANSNAWEDGMANGGAYC
jgi:hypothetical protein